MENDRAELVAEVTDAKTQLEEASLTYRKDMTEPLIVGAPFLPDKIDKEVLSIHRVNPKGFVAHTLDIAFPPKSSELLPANCSVKDEDPARSITGLLRRVVYPKAVLTSDKVVEQLKVANTEIEKIYSVLTERLDYLRRLSAEAFVAVKEAETKITRLPNEQRRACYPAVKELLGMAESKIIDLSQHHAIERRELLRVVLKSTNDAINDIADEIQEASDNLFRIHEEKFNPKVVIRVSSIDRMMANMQSLSNASAALTKECNSLDSKIMSYSAARLRLTHKPAVKDLSFDISSLPDAAQSPMKDFQSALILYTAAVCEAEGLEELKKLEISNGRVTGALHEYAKAAAPFVAHTLFDHKLPDQLDYVSRDSWDAVMNASAELGSSEFKLREHDLRLRLESSKQGIMLLLLESLLSLSVLAIIALIFVMGRHTPEKSEKEEVDVDEK